jgi:hypothetical protein
LVFHLFEVSPYFLLLVLLVLLLFVFLGWTLSFAPFCL